MQEVEGTVEEVAKDEASKFLRAATKLGVAYFSSVACPPLIPIAATSGVLSAAGEYAPSVATNEASRFLRSSAIIATAAYLAPALTTGVVVGVGMYLGYIYGKKALSALSEKVSENDHLKEWWKKWRAKCKVTLGGSKLFDNIKKGKGKLKGIFSVLKEGIKTYKNRMFGMLKSRLGRSNSK